jgi:RHS repeat-associated protein
VGLYFYNARWYDDSLGRFIQPDSIVPEAIQGTQAWDRFAYSNNSPIIHNDPSGHCLDGISTAFCIAVAVGGVTGGISSAVGYIAATKMPGQDINFKSLVIATGTGVVAGVLTPIIAITAPVTAIVPTTLVMYGTVATTQYIIDQKVNNKPVDTVSAVANFGVGSLTGIIGGVYSPFDEIGREGMSQGLKLGMDFGKQAQFQGEKIAAQEFINYQVKNGLSNLARTITTSLFQTLAPRMWEHKTIVAQ